MKSLIFIKEIFRKYPLVLFSNILLSFAVIFCAAGSLLAISPVVDFLIHPDFQGISPLTSKAIKLLQFFRLPVSLESWLIVFISFIILTSFFQILARRAILKTKYTVLKEIMLGTFDDFFSARWYFFSSGKQGVLLNTFTREIANVGDAFGAVATFFSNGLQLIFFLIVPFYISWQVTTISLLIALLFAVPFILLGKISYKLGVQNTSTSNKIMSVIHENLSLSKVVLGFGNQHISTKNLAQAFDAHQKVTIKSQVLDRAIGILYRPFGLIMVVIALFVAKHFNVSLSEITVLLLALLQVTITIGDLTTQKNSLDSFFPSYEQIMNLRNRAKDLKQESGEIKFDSFTQDILVNDVTFSYPNHPAVLSEVKIRISKGKMTAIVGESGAGKSTIIDLIMGFHSLNKGNITIDGVDLRDFDIISYRKKIGYVPQDSVLFNMSIKENFLWAYESATDQDIIQACQQANAYEFIKNFPEGLNTVVGDRGVRLSGGQVQRLALARAILRKPELLILDEATSSLDANSERLIQEAIEKIAKETTIIVIAHRLSTIVHSDYVYVLSRGSVVEEGPYLELIKKKGHFNRMVELQLLELNK